MFKVKNRRICFLASRGNWQKFNKKTENVIEWKIDCYFGYRTPRSAGSQGQQYTQYEWTSPGNKPSSPFVAKEKKAMLFEANKPRPGTAEAEIEGKRIIFIVV